MNKTIYGQSKVMGFDPKVINLVKISSHYFYFISYCFLFCYLLWNIFYNNKLGLSWVYEYEYTVYEYEYMSMKRAAAA